MSELNARHEGSANDDAQADTGPNAHGSGGTDGNTHENADGNTGENTDGNTDGNTGGTHAADGTSNADSSETDLDRLATEMGKAKPRKKVAMALVDLVKSSSAELFHTPEGDSYATVYVAGHRCTWPIKSQDFGAYVIELYLSAEDEAPSANALQDAMNTLSALARFRGPCIPVYVRTAQIDGVIYVDIGDENHTVIKVTESGWSEEAGAPVRFRRPRGMQSLPKPEKGGAIDELRRYLNVPELYQWRLLLVWLIVVFFTRGPFAFLVLRGGQGAAKSTVARVIRRLCDPNKADLRAQPGSEKDLVISARNCKLVVFDNISKIENWLSDALCRLATGGGFATRELWTNLDEVIVEVCRPALLTGIDDSVHRSDLLDRCLLVELPEIDEDHRRTEEEFWGAFDEASGRIFGAVLDTLSGVLRCLPQARAQLVKRPRMADFAERGVAVELALGWERGAFTSAYERNRDDANEIAIEASPIGSLICDLARLGWEGTPTELLRTLDRLFDQQGEGAGDDSPATASARPRQRPRAWPTSTKALKNYLVRLLPNLNAKGVTVEFWQTPGTNSKKRVSIRMTSGPDTPTGGGTGPSGSGSPLAPESNAGESLATPTTTGTPSGSMPIVTAPELELVTSRTRAAEACAIIASNAKVGLDIETFPASLTPGKSDALDHGKNRVRLVQIATPDGKVTIFDLVALAGLPPDLVGLLINPNVKKVIYNAHFDMGAIHRHYGVEIKNVADLYAGALLVAGYVGYRAKGEHTLEREVGRYLGVALPKEAALSNWGAENLSTEQIEYAARDAGVLLPLHDKLVAEADRVGVSQAWEIENETIFPMVKAETAGIGVDRAGLDGLIAAADIEANDAGRRAREELGNDGLNLNSPSQILGAVETKYGVALEGTAEDVLEDYTAVAPAVTHILAYRRAKGRSATLHGYRDAIQPDGRIHARFNILAAPTGRMGCNSPNLLAVPRDPAVRSIFIPRPGFVFVVADFSASQMRVVAHITQDPELLACFCGVPPTDPHTRTAAKLFGKTVQEVTAAERKYAKPANFGLIFGMSARGLVDYAKSTYGIHLTLEEAQAFRAAFFDLYVGVRDWHWRTSRIAWAESSARTASGRLRILEQRNGAYSLTEHLNTPVQGLEADGVKRAISIISAHLEPLGGVIVNVIHDEIVAEVPEAVAEEAKSIVVSGMVSGMAEFMTTVPVVVDAGIFTSWAKP